MPVVMISRGSYVRGGEVATEVARRLGFRCLAREHLLAASTEFDVPAARLVEAMEGAVTFLDHLNSGRQRYVAYIRSALLEALREDNVVYHGFAGHFFLSDVGHVLKVRIEAESEERIAAVMGRDGLGADAARALIAEVDRERLRWSQRLYGLDSRDPRLYDLVLQIGRLTVADAATMVCAAAGLPQFQATPSSIQRLEDLALAARVHASLAELSADLEVVAEQRRVTIRTLPQMARSSVSVEHIERRARSVAGVGAVVVAGDLAESPADAAARRP